MKRNRKPTGTKSENGDEFWKLSKLQLRDWDFRPETCRESELESCWVYEYSREIKALREAVADSRKRNSDYVKHFEAANKSARGDRPLRLGTALMESLSKPPVPLAYRYHPQWPDTPFSLLKPKPGNEQPRRLFEYFQKDIGDFALELTARPDWLRLPKTLWDEEGKSETIVLTIPWLYNNDLLKEGFAQWLEDNRPKGKAGDLRPKVEPKKKPTGRGSRPWQLRASLKALGAYRLMLCFKGNRWKAKGHQVNGKCVEDILGKNFAQDSAWSGAKRAAEWGIERITSIKQDHLKMEQLRLKWETDPNYRKECDERFRL